MTSAVVFITAGILGLCALALTVRMTIGPTVLDRAMTFDMVVSITIIGLALYAAVRREVDTVPMLLALTLLGFVGSVSIARFIDPRDVDDGDDDNEEGPS
ncbi:monovalent cation/H+ antiporter complex subunit F [Nocardioides massiliensis]|uniref:Multicomponent Na+:H+ antiporter subunit F n=1 Tax=Nocardioides massiliensis TaxID=1325935 RepID=A0ABT9NM28_9ACTN|nr:monovalent cation/H+ antiporter complex subunit F [Nocardioides massiliensis]MDP9821472.1 multicomponent Na+:H+ antiporter subunit F [Nocardioides massiliensis]